MFFSVEQTQECAGRRGGRALHEQFQTGVCPCGAAPLSSRTQSCYPAVGDERFMKGCVGVPIYVLILYRHFRQLPSIAQLGQTGWE